MNLNKEYRKKSSGKSFLPSSLRISGTRMSIMKRKYPPKALSMLPVKDITAVTGYVRGGCTALGMKRKYPTVVDASAEALPEMVVSGGRLGCQIELNPVDLCRAAEGFFADVADISVS